MNRLSSPSFNYLPSQPQFLNQARPLLIQHQPTQSYQPIVYIQQPTILQQRPYQTARSLPFSQSSLPNPNVQFVPLYNNSNNQQQQQIQRRNNSSQPTTTTANQTNKLQKNILERGNIRDIQQILPQQLIDYNEMINISKQLKIQDKLKTKHDQISLPTNDQNIQNNSSYHMNNDNKSLQSEPYRIQEIKPLDMSCYQNVISLDTSKMMPSEEIKPLIDRNQIQLNMNLSPQEDEVSFSQRFPFVPQLYDQQLLIQQEENRVHGDEEEFNEFQRKEDSFLAVPHSTQVDMNAIMHQEDFRMNFERKQNEMEYGIHPSQQKELDEIPAISEKPQDISNLQEQIYEIQNIHEIKEENFNHNYHNPYEKSQYEEEMQHSFRQQPQIQAEIQQDRSKQFQHQQEIVFHSEQPISFEKIPPINHSQNNQFSPLREQNNSQEFSDVQYSPIQSLHVFMSSTEKPTHFQPKSNILVQSESPQKQYQSPQKQTNSKLQSPQNPIKSTNALFTPQRLDNFPCKMTITPQILVNTPYQYGLNTNYNSVIINNNSQVPVITLSSQDNSLPIQNVNVLYRSVNNPDFHYNINNSDFYKTPERSKDAASSVFFSPGEKMPTKIKIKYTPVEELLSPQELSNLKICQNEVDNIHPNQIRQPTSHQNSLGFLASSINYLQSIGTHQQ